MVQGEVVVEAVVQQNQRAKLTSHENALKIKKEKARKTWDQDVSDGIESLLDLLAIWAMSVC